MVSFGHSKHLVKVRERSKSCFNTEKVFGDLNHKTQRNVILTHFTKTKTLTDVVVA